MRMAIENAPVGAAIPSIQKGQVMCLDAALPNGSRLSCGASADGRKHPALLYELAGAQTYASSEGRPRQLQALVRQHARASVHRETDSLVMRSPVMFQRPPPEVSQPDSMRKATRRVLRARTA